MSNISILNLYCQKLKVNPPLFEIIQKDGFDHHPTYKISCKFQDKFEIGEGTSLKVAKEAAATKIVNMLEIEHKLKELGVNPVYSLYSYDAPLSDIWNNNKSEYTLTLKKKSNENIEFKIFKVTIHPEN